MTTVTGPLITSKTIQELSPGLLALAFRAVRQREEAEDLVQETWLSAMRSAASFAGRSTLRTWVIGILRRRVADHFRRRHLSELLDEEKLPCDAETAAERFDVCSTAVMATRALSDLTELERAAVTLCSLHELDRDEASESMGVTRGHLRVLLHRAHHKLEASLRASGVEGVTCSSTRSMKWRANAAAV